jgi:predicted hydrocarbon binding protein
VSEEAPIETFGSFAQALFTFGRLSELQSQIDNVIKNSKIPWSESRKLLKCAKVSEAMNTPLFQYMKMVFEQVGLGTLSISRIGKFKISFIVDNCAICKLFPNVKNKKTCIIIGDALSQFFCKDMDIENKTTEVRCRNSGDEVCEFQVEMQPLEYYQIIFDDGSNKLLKSIVEHSSEKAKDMNDINDINKFIIKIGGEIGLEEDEVLYRMMELREYMLFDENYKITELGETYYRYINSNLVRREKKGEPPWLNLKIISDNIADSASFANAFSKSASTMKDMKEKDKRKEV